MGPQQRWQRIILLTVLACEGLGALAGSSLLVSRPDGHYMNMSVGIMHGTFEDFLIPGLILFALGLLNVAAFVAVLRRSRAAWIAAGLALGGLAVWFFVEILILRELHWLHVIWGLPVIVGLLTRIHCGKDGASISRPAIAIRDAAAEFLAKKRIAVTGVSRKADPHGSNLVYRRLRERGYEVFAINPNAAEVEGDRCFPDLKSIPGGVEAVVIATRPEHAMVTMHETAELGIDHVWMHRLVGVGSVSEEAAAWGRQRGMRVIDGGCPLMFGPTSDSGHKFMRRLFTLTGKVPRRV
jgi:predicted CoA-binding protein